MIILYDSYLYNPRNKFKNFKLLCSSGYLSEKDVKPLTRTEYVTLSPFDKLLNSQDLNS